MEFGTSQKAVKRPHLTLSLPCLFWSAAKPGNVCRTSGFHFQRKFGQLECGTFSRLLRLVWAGLLVNVTGSQWGNLPLVPSPLPGLKGEKILRTKVCLVCSTLSARRPRVRVALESRDKVGVASSDGGELLPHFHEKRRLWRKMKEALSTVELRALTKAVIKCRIEKWPLSPFPFKQPWRAEPWPYFC